MIRIKKLLKKFDVFGVPFSFKYKNEGSFTTAAGGFFFIIFLIVLIVIGIYYFIPFFNRKNFTIIYYTMNMVSTDQIKLSDSKAAFAFGLTCDVDKDGTKAEDLFKLDISFYTQTKNRDRKTVKTGRQIPTHPCNYSDFYNNYNESLDLINIQNYQCLDETNNTIEGIYTDESFTYYRFTVATKKDSPEHFNKIDRYLTRNDCKLQLYYTDITIDFNDYKEPIKPYLNALFIQMNPTLFIKMNTYFMNQYFENDNYLFFVFEDGKPEVKTLFSRVEEYALYLGLNRGESKPNDYKNYARIFIRADTKKTEIKRKYQKVMEFYADASSLLVALFYGLTIIFDFINSFYAEHALNKRLFYFKDIEGNLDISKKSQKINNLINLIQPIVDGSTKTPRSIEQNNKYSILLPPLKKREDNEIAQILENADLNIYNLKKFKKMEYKDREDLSTEKELMGKERKIFFKQKKKEDEKNENNFDLQSIKKKYKIVNKLPTNLKDNNLSGRNIPTIENKRKKKSKKIEFSYNIGDVVVSSFFCCLMTKNLKSKANLTNKANEILYNKLDIFLYIKNMILLDIMNKIILNGNGGNREGIVKFLVRPIISLDKDEKEKDFNYIYSHYTENDLDKLYDEMIEIVNSSERINNEKDFITITNKRLRDFI